MTDLVLPYDINGYQLLDAINAGGFGAVYRAQQTTVGREVAVKIIRPEHANKPEFIRRFELEAQIVARLEHPHITPLHDYWRDPSGAYLVMRLLKGGSLRDRLNADQRLNVAVIGRFLAQIAAGLDFAHRKEVIHRDIKPGNFLLDEDDNIYIADFGIAKDLSDLQGQMTDPENVMGSLDYISPEQARSDTITGRTDIYSLGVTLYELLVGKHPFHDVSIIERLYKHINDPLPDLPEIDGISSDMHGSLNEIVQKATQKNPANRYETVISLATAFNQAIGVHVDEAEQSSDLVEQLTWREQEILQYLVQGLSNKEIAAELVVSVPTVRWHLRNLYKKVGAQGRMQLIVRARDLDLVVTQDGDGERSTRHTIQDVLTSIGEADPENPYKGLRSFKASDTQDFFGRESVVEKLLHKIQDDHPYGRFLAVIGPSGSGKSSLVKAGLIPALWRGDLPNSEKWFIVDMLPGDHPLDKLETALLRVASTQQELYEQLSRDERGLSRVADIILPDDETELVIVVDQFEEVFTLVSDEAERQHFLNLLYEAVNASHSRIRVIVTLRADYYDRPLHYPEFGEMLKARMETILPLSAQGIERAIREPAKRVGVTFEDGLVAQIVSQMNYQTGALPLLQYALTELFRRRDGLVLTNHAYAEMGGAIGALANRADEILNSLSTHAQGLARQMFLRLVTLGEGAEDTRRRVTFTELLSLTDTPDMMEDIIDSFADARLLSLDHDPKLRQPTVEVAHEAILREWERLRIWLNDNREDIRQERWLSQATDEWESSDFDSSFLLTGNRLAQVETWYDKTRISLTPNEKQFITESINNRAYRQKAELERKARESEVAQRAAQYEMRARQFRQASTTLGLMVVIAIVAIIVSIQTTRNAQSQRMDVERQATQFSVEIGRAATLAAGGAIVAIGQSDPVADNIFATVTQVANLNNWQPVIEEFDGVQMVQVPTGCFTMGSVFQPNEQPVHEVCLNDDYWIDRYEITTEQYNQCVAAGVCNELVGSTSASDLQPVNRASWFQADTYCTWRGGRLPTEAEWEYAARGADGLRYPWGNDFVVDNAVYSANAGNRLADVGTRPDGASWVGAYDMSGNVWEWTQSIYQEYPYIPTDGRELRLDEESPRVLRGGSYVDSENYLRTSYRYVLAPNYQSLNFFSSGMRCVRIAN